MFPNPGTTEPRSIGVRRMFPKFRDLGLLDPADGVNESKISAWQGGSRRRQVPGGGNASPQASAAIGEPAAVVVRCSRTPGLLARGPAGRGGGLPARRRPHRAERPRRQIINAGDVTHEHPTQALLAAYDCWAIRLFRRPPTAAKDKRPSDVDQVGATCAAAHLSEARVRHRRGGADCVTCAAAAPLRRGTLRVDHGPLWS